jgi:GrpB-like predicted nucleotidyltransferase (UPF0157 family)
VGERPRLDGPVRLDEYDPRWPERYELERTRLRATLGERVVAIHHVGSTSVPGLAAKPIVDITLEVVDSADEDAYLADLDAAGYRLVVREPDWFEHRVLLGPVSDINLHVFTAGCPEVARMLRFRDRLRSDADDRARYERTKRELAARTWEHVQQYADAKDDVVADIMRRAGAG